MPAQKSTANASKPSTAARRRTTRARIAKIAQAEAASQHTQGFLETVVESVKEVPGRVGHAVEKAAEVAGSTVMESVKEVPVRVGQVAEKVAEVAGAAVVESVKEVPGRVGHAVEKVAEVAGAAVEKTGALVGDLADKVGLGDSKEASDDAQGKRK